MHHGSEMFHIPLNICSFEEFTNRQNDKANELWI